MTIQRLATILTAVNLVLLLVLVGQVRPTMAQEGVAPVLRGRALEIVDAQGRVRASIVVHPADPTVTKPDGKPYPETVMLRLIDPQGRPEVKLGASEQGAGLGLVGATDATHVLLKTEGTNAFLKLTNNDGREQLVKP